MKVNLTFYYKMLDWVTSVYYRHNSQEMSILKKQYQTLFFTERLKKT